VSIKKMDNEYEATGGMRICRRYGSTLRERPVVPFCAPHDPTWDRTGAAVMGNRQIIARVTARPRDNMVSLTIPLPLHHFFLVFLLLLLLLLLLLASKR
jgi:hypothetical protein